MSEVEITHESHPHLANAFMLNAGFTRDLNDPEAVKNARWNLIISKRDIDMWVKHGMKPHRGWAITPVKKYFGLKGHGQALLNDFLALEAEVKSLMG